MYYPFVRLAFIVCQHASIVQGNFVRIKVVLETVTVALMSIKFMLEVVNALDYIQETRIALISYSKVLGSECNVENLLTSTRV